MPRGRPKMPLSERLDIGTYKDPDGCWIWTGTLDKNGYGVIKDEAKKSTRVHRAMFLRYNGPIPDDKPFILHTCDNPPCCNPAHLRAGTAQENSDDMVAKGRSKKSAGCFKPGQQAGDKNHTAKLTWEQVRQIRALPKPWSLKEIGIAYGITPESVSNILRNKTWIE